MARPRTPTATLEVRGSFKQNPQRSRPGEPKQTAEIGAPPHLLPKSAKECWHEIVANAAPGVLTAADRWAVELAATLMADFRYSRKDFSASKMARLHALMAEMGLTPAKRAAMSIAPAEDDDDPFAAVFGHA